MRISAAGLFLFTLMFPAFAQEFGGTWMFSREEPQTGSLPEAPAEALEIVQESNLVRCTARRRAGDKPLIFSFTLDGKETKAKDGAKTLSTEAKWEGSALLVNTIVNGPSSSYTQMDRWRVSRDGGRLTIRREIVRRDAHAESVLVYRRK
jgi:hypothetical protein